MQDHFRVTRGSGTAPKLARRAQLESTARTQGRRQCRHVSRAAPASTRRVGLLIANSVPQIRIRPPKPLMVAIVPVRMDTLVQMEAHAKRALQGHTKIAVDLYPAQIVQQGRIRLKWEQHLHRTAWLVRRENGRLPSEQRRLLLASGMRCVTRASTGLV